MTYTHVEILATVCFVLALLHTFSTFLFNKIASRFPSGSVGENFFHLLAEVEVVFGFWATLFLIGRVLLTDGTSTLQYLEGLHYTEPAFVFVIMAVCSTRPILSFVARLIELISRALPLPKQVSFYVSALIIGPLLGSFVTEPAAMTVIALILYERFFSKGISSKLMYGTLGLLFVNVSIGGTLTPYAAPPVLMVASKWGWDMGFMLSTFAWRAARACSISAILTALYFRKELVRIPWEQAKNEKLPAWITLLHLSFLAAIVMSTHHMVLFVGLFLLFLGVYQVTMEYQSELKIKEGLLVAFFLGGLVVLGTPQRWWLEPLLTSLGADALFWGATGLTAITDNAALTYLGAQVPSLSEAARLALVSGAVVGGGLTVIANAPNPAGYGILNPAFPDGGIKAHYLLAAAAGPTAVAAICFWLI